MKKFEIIIVLLLISIVAISATLMNQDIQQRHLSVIKKRVVAGGEAQVWYEDFSTDPKTSRWNDEAGSATWDNVSENLDVTSGDVFIHNTALGSINGYMKMTWTTRGSFSGFYFRYDGTITNDAYCVRANNATTWVWRECVGASCTDIESTTEATLADGDSVAIAWSGTGDATTVSLWINPSGNLPSGWGAATHTFTNNPTNAADVGKECGVYDGGALTETFDDIYAGNQ